VYAWHLFGELLFASNHPDPRRLDAGESQPVLADNCFEWLHNHVSDAGVQVESGKDPPIHSSFDRIAGPAIGAAVKSMTGAPIEYSNQSPRGI
jgi:hypothetical protein